MRVEFIETFNWIPPAQRMVTIQYKAGSEHVVPRPCALAAIKAGAARKVKAKTARETDDGAPAANG